MPGLEARRASAAALLGVHRDLLNSRPDVEVRDARLEPDAAVDTRGWSPFLLGLTETELQRLEGAGVDGDWSAAPASLQAFVDDVRRVTAVRQLLDEVPRVAPRRHEPWIKQRQIDVFSRWLARVAPDATRIVDVGSGHGHLTRALAAALGRPVVGLERDPAIAARARALAAHDDDVAFAVTDVVRSGLAVQAGDGVVGLHACGQLGDLAAVAVASAGVPATLAFVGCCLQKQHDAWRHPLDDAEPRLSLPKPLLGLSNLTTRDTGVEAVRADNLAGRCRRIALRLLLADAGVVVRPRAELEGLNRRAAHEPLAVLVALAFGARGLALPSAPAIDAADVAAHTLHDRFRRLALPRSLLGRVIEVFVLFDRGLFLERRGFDVDVGVLFPAALSPRNLALVATSSPARRDRPSLR